MADQALLPSLRARLPDAASAPDALLLSYLADAAALICALTVPPELESAQVRLAVIFFNRMGMEGEREHAEGDVRRAAEDLPDALRREIFSFRLAKV